MKKWNADKWVESEIDEMMDLYGNTRQQAATFVLDLLVDNEYREELDDNQTAAAIPVARNKAIDATAVEA